MVTKTIKQTVHFKASPHEVYEALMDEKKHSQFTSGKATVSREVRGEFSVSDGEILGKNVELVQDKKIVQDWYCQTGGWPKGHFSRATFTLTQTKEGTRLDFLQTGVPEGAFDDISSGWHEYYWNPMTDFFKTQ